MGYCAALTSNFTFLGAVNFKFCLHVTVATLLRGNGGNGVYPGEQGGGVGGGYGYTYAIITLNSGTLH